MVEKSCYYFSKICSRLFIPSFCYVLFYKISTISFYSFLQLAKNIFLLSAQANHKISFWKFSGLLYPKISLLYIQILHLKRAIEWINRILKPKAKEKKKTHINSLNNSWKDNDRFQNYENYLWRFYFVN